MFQVNLGAERIGTSHVSNSGHKCVVVGYNTSTDVIIQVESGHTYSVEWSKLIKGQFKDPNQPLVFGVGYMGVGFDKFAQGKDRIKARDHWYGMMERCYDPVTKKNNPAYDNCIVDNSWHNFTTFTEWYSKRKQAFMKGWCLDKDIIEKGNKIYSQDKCTLVPREVNTFIAWSNRSKEKNTLGANIIYRPKIKKYTVQKYDEVTYNSKQGKRLRVRFSTYEEALEFANHQRIMRAKYLANKYKDLLDDIVYEKLMNWQVDYYQS